jgi:hypothetical protein
MKWASLFVAIALFLSGCGENAVDNEISRKVGKYLDATGVVPDDTSTAYKSHVGKIVYVGPGTKGRPHFTYYEVTSPEDIQKLKAAAEMAIKEIPEANKIYLHFMEKEVFHSSGNGGGYRGREKEIQTVVVERK